jgi:hypothetical protein
MTLKWKSRGRNVFDVFYNDGWDHCVTVRIIGSGVKRRLIYTGWVRNRMVPVSPALKLQIETSKELTHGRQRLV